MTIQQSQVQNKANRALVIADMEIHRDSEGRYSLNDLHKASGGEQRHRPKYWLELQQTCDLIDEILKGVIPPFNPAESKKGRYGGTYACKELVYAYAMWISAAFALKVIRAYDALVTGNIEEAKQIAKTSVEERTPLRDAVNMLVSKRHIPYNEAYLMIHQRFGVSSIEDMTHEQVTQAIEYAHRIVLEGEYIERETAIAFPRQFSDEELVLLSYLWLWFERSRMACGAAYPAMVALSSPLAGRFGDIARETRFIADECRTMLARESARITSDSLPVRHAADVLATLRGDNDSLITH